MKLLAARWQGQGQGGQVPVVDPPGIQRSGERSQRRGPRRALRDGGHGYFLNDGGEPVDLYGPVDNLDGGAPRGGRTGKFPSPVAA